MAGKSFSIICISDSLLQIKLVNINSSDLVDGRPPVVLGLIWTIILYFQVDVLPLVQSNTIEAIEKIAHVLLECGSCLNKTPVPHVTSNYINALRYPRGSTATIVCSGD